MEKISFCNYNLEWFLFLGNFYRTLYRGQTNQNKKQETAGTQLPFRRFFFFDEEPISELIEEPAIEKASATTFGHSIIDDNVLAFDTHLLVSLVYV